MELVYSAIKRTPTEHQFAFAFSSVPEEDESVVDEDAVLEDDAP